LLVVACLLLTGCGSSQVTRLAMHPRSRAPSRTAAQRCADAARMRSDVALPAWHMGAVQFFSATSGVGLTAETFPCFRPIRGGSQEVGFQRQPVGLAVTSDGGRSWHVTGTTVPVGPVPDGVVAEQITAFSPADIWAVVGSGRLMATRDGGSDWQAQAVPTPVADLIAADGFVWVVSCRHVARRTSAFGCRPQLWRTRSATASWTRVALPRVTAPDPFAVRFAVTSRDMIIGLTEVSDPPNGELLTTRDAGLRWTKRRAPRWEHNKCDNGAALTAHAPRTFWLLCIGGGAAGSSAKGLLRSTDAGRTWTTVSAVRSVVQRLRPGSIPLEEPSALAAGSDARLWLSLTNGLAESNDGGRRWTDVPQAFDTGGWTTVIDVFSASHAWLLAPGAGLWRTTDGLHWRAIRPLNTG
jgi:photosystem II stability/assembly factor-like uncharacterized protein